MKAQKMKYLLMMVVALIMVLALAACNNSSEPEPTPEPTPVATPEPTPEPEEEEPEAEEVEEVFAEDEPDAEAYLAAMLVFIDAFEELTVVLFELIEVLDYVETDEELLEWIDAFELIMHAMAVSEEELTSAALLAPEEYLESHILLTAAVSLMHDSMVEFDNALLAAVHGDYDAFWEGIEGFVINMVAADLLWNEAIYGPQDGQVDPALVGVWGWEDYLPWAYTFNADGTGHRVLPDGEEAFTWEADGNELWLDRGTGTPADELRIEHWSYSIAGDVLTIESMQVADVILNYIRQ